MTAASFLIFADPLPEAMLLLSTSGVVLAGNRAVEQRLGVALVNLRGKQLADVVADAYCDVDEYLRSCCRSGSLVPGSLELLATNGTRVSCRTEGARLQPDAQPAEGALLLRLIPRASAVGRFVALNQQVDGLAAQIRRRRQAEAEARQQANHLRVTLQSIGDGVIVTDCDARVRLLNPIAQAMTGWTESEAIARPLEEVFRIVNEFTRQPVENPAMRALREGVIVGLANHTLLVSRDGTDRPIDDSGAPIVAEDGELLGAILVFRDVTQRHIVEQQLHRSAEQFRQLADAMPHIVWTAGPDGQIEFMNRQWTEFTGLPATVGNAGWGEILHPDDRLPAREQWLVSLQKGVPFEMPLRLLQRSQRTYRWHLFRTVPALDDAGKIVRWFGTSTDIHNQKLAEQSSRYLADASAVLAEVVDYESTLHRIADLAVPRFSDWSAVDVADEDGRMRRLAVSHQDPLKVEIVHEVMRRYPPEPDAPRGPPAVFRTGEPEIVNDISDDILRQFARDEAHLDLLQSLGLKSYICVPLVVSGQPLGVLTFATAQSGRSYTADDLSLATDLANRAAVAIENTQLYQALRDADRRKDEFLATLAHELRNPLAPIRNALQILKMPRVDAGIVARSRDMMERQVEHLVRLVDDLLDVSRVMRGKIALRTERLELADVVARAVETVQPLIDAQGHELSIHLPSDPLLVDADVVRLAQVVGNLLTNAAKYTEPGGHIWLTANRVGQVIELRVRDTGIGIERPLLSKIFELFVQTDPSSTRARGGLGIGLTLVRNLVEMHHGTVEARSNGTGQGSEFIVRLPASSQATLPEHVRETGPQSTHHASARSGLRLLVVDDNQDAADTLAMLLELQGHEVRIAYSGAAALDLATDFMPDVVFLDIGMPDMDGYEVARRMRLQPSMTRVVVAALTGWGQTEDRHRSRAAGFNHHLVKPPEPSAIEAILADITPARRAQPHKS